MKVGIEAGSEIDLDIEDSCLVIKPKMKSLDELLSTITPDNLHSEFHTGKPQGREQW